MEHPQVTQDYHDLPGLSHSRLKLLERSPIIFKEKMDAGWPRDEDPESYHTEGDMIDKILLDYAAFKDTYVEQTWETPSSPNQLEFCQRVAGGEDPEQAYDACYARNLKPETLKTKATELLKQHSVYIGHLKNNDTRIPYSPSDGEMLMAIQTRALKHPWISKLLEHDSRKTHYIIQDELFDEPFKCEVDLLVQTKKALWNIDIKSTFDYLSNFPREYRKHGYGNQQSLYETLLYCQQDKDLLPNLPIKTVCIAVSKRYPYEAGLFEVSDQVLSRGWSWIKEQVQRYKYHKENGFDFPPRTYEKGMEFIDVYNPNK